MQINPYLNFDGNCAEAMKTYSRIFGGSLEEMPFSDVPEACAGLPEDARSRIMHACLTTDGAILMASDAMPGQFTAGMANNVAVAITLDTVERARDVCHQLAEGGKVNMPFAETFWVEGFGAVTDRYGISWLVNGGKSKM